MKFILCFICVSLCLVPLAQIKVQKTGDKASHHITTKTERLCAGDAIKTHLMGLYPFLAEKERSMNNTIRFADANRRNREEDQYISVVVHIMHNFGEENISDEMVAQGIQHLNDAFANTGDYASADGTDSHIRFCLAQQDTAGMPTSGINRVVSNLTYVVMENDDLNLKNTIRWDPERYLNIWLVGEIYSLAMGNAVAGYATLPYAHGLPEDGIVNEARWFGANADYSKVHIHEVGHYLGLYHTFEAGCSNADCTMEGDLVCDTPPDQSTNALLCSDAENSCDSDDDDNSENNPFRSTALGGLGDQFDLIENYMDYGSQNCQTHFSAGQIERMQVALNEQRASLLESNGCVNSCGIGTVQIVSESEEILGGQPAFFNQNTQANIPVNYAWQFNGEVIGTAPELTYIFSGNQVGNAWLTLTISGLNGECPQQDSLLLSIGCNPPAAFTMSPNYPDVDEAITFVATSPGATQFQWYVDGVLTGAGPTYQTAFSTGGFHQIYLVAGNGICMDTSEMDYFGVGACPGRADNNWIFGGSFGVRLDFSSGVPEVTTVPQGPESVGLYTIEGIATISDQNGDLLFYCDGGFIYNRLYEPFYQNLEAGSSSSQGVQIVPDPGNANRYYVFTTGNFADYGQTYGLGFAYVIVDMTENNGLGGVVSNYIELLPIAHERQTAVRHCNGRDIWIICQEWPSGAFYSYLLTETGISPPVISEIPSQTAINFIGYLAASPQGNKIAVTSYYSGMLLFDFNNETGTFIDSYPLTNVATSTFVTYGVAFSPDGSKLYFNNGQGGYNIHQVDLSSGNDFVISNSLQVVGVSNTPYYLGAIQAGPDGKLYIAQANGVHLDVIHQPNIGGLGCAFETDAIALPMNIYFGLNNVLVGSTENSGPQITGLSEVCEFATGLTYTANCGNNVWTLSGNASLTELSSTEVNVSFASAGIVYLMCTSTDLCYGTKTDTLLIRVGNPDISLGNDTTICSSGSITLGTGAQIFSGYLWSNGFVTPNITVQNAGVYWVEVTGGGGCSSRDSIEVTEFNQPFDVVGDTVFICATNNSDGYYPVHAPDNGYEHFWYSPNGQTVDSITPYFIFAYAPWQVPIYYRNENGCIDASTIHVAVRPELPDEFLGPDAVLCPGEIVLIEIDETACPECTYTWQDGSTANPYTIYTPLINQSSSLYALRFDPVCNWPAYDYINVYGIYPEYIALPDTVVSCDLYSSWLQVYADLFDSISWQDGSTSPVYSITSPGTYWITATSVCGVFSDTTVAVGPVLNSLNLPESIALCAHQLPYALPVDGNFYNYQWSNNNGGWVYEAGEIAVMATDFCIEVYDTLTVSVNPSPEINIPEIIQSCSDTTVVLSLPTAPGQVNYWQGIMQNNLDVSETGFYTYTAQHPSGCAIQDSVQVVISNLYFTIPDSTLCPGSILEFSPETNAPLWLWNLEDNETITITDTGMYVVYISDMNCSKLVNFHITQSDDTDYDLMLPDSLSACSNELPITVEAMGDVAENYAWSNGDSTATALLYNQGWYVLNTAYACGAKSDSTYLTIEAVPPTVLPADTVLCNNATLVLSGPIGYSNNWSSGEQTDTVLINQPGLVVLNSLSEFGCMSSDSIEVLASDLSISIPDKLMLCPGDSLALIASTNGNTYFWNTGEASLSIVIDSPGNYQFTASSNFCNESNTVAVVAWPDLSFNLGEDLIVTAATTTISAPEGFDDYSWNVNGQNESSITVSENGTYALTVTDENGCMYQDEIRVFFNRPSNESFIEVPDIFSPDNGLVAQYNNVSVYDVKIFDAAGRLVNYGNTFPLLWDGRYSEYAAATGMYYYLINYADSAGKKHLKKGNSLLID